MDNVLVPNIIYRSAIITYTQFSHVKANVAIISVLSDVLEGIFGTLFFKSELIDFTKEERKKHQESNRHGLKKLSH